MKVPILMQLIKEGRTPLIYTLMENRTEAAKLLLEKGADSQVKDKCWMQSNRLCYFKWAT